jgi:hypothetical protein
MFHCAAPVADYDKGKFQTGWILSQPPVRPDGRIQEAVSLGKYYLNSSTSGVA